MTESSNSATLAAWSGVALSLLAIALPFIREWYARTFKKPTVTAHLVPYIDLGYVQTGHTVCVFGSLVSSNRSCFVERIRLTVIRKRDRSQLHIVGVAFRPLRFLFPPASQTEFTLATGINIAPDKPEPFGVLCAPTMYDKVAAADAERIHSVARPAVERLKHELRIKHPDVDEDALHRTALKMSMETNEVSEALRVVWNRINTAFYWTAGEFEALLSFDVVGDARSISKKFTFSISEDDSERLQRNAASIANAHIEPDLPYFHVHTAEIEVII